MKLQNRYLVAVLFIIGCLLTRLAPHPANMTALGALALWSHRFFPHRWGAFLLPLMALILSDLVLGFHSTLIWVYGAFLLVGIASLWLDPAKSQTYALLGGFASASIFFIISNLGVWFSGELYPMTAEGLQNCYIMALPFFKNQILGDLFYSAVCFAFYKFQLGYKTVSV